MSKIEENDIQKIAYLARMKIDENDLPEYAHSLNEILDFVEQMDNADTSSIDAMAHPQDLTQRLRKDVVTEQDQREKLMANAPVKEDGLFLVPKVIE